jgi:hypothetical protein
MINPDLSKYDLIFGKYHLEELIESITLEDSLDEMAYRANIRLRKIPELPTIEAGQKMDITGIPFGATSTAKILSPGVIWDIDEEEENTEVIPITIYDLSIYLVKSEDEYLFPAGQTATKRIQQYAADWKIPLGSLANTSIPLAKAVYRAQSIYSHIQTDLSETAIKGGDMFRLRMAPSGLELVKIGSNSTVWRLESGSNIERKAKHSTLEGTITRVKVLGNAEEELRSPVLAVVDGEIGKYGTIQKVLSDNKITDSKAAKTSGQKLLSGVQDTISVTGIDINTLRAGDKVKLNGTDIYITMVRHELGNPGRMVLELADIDHIRRRYFERSF